VLLHEVAGTSAAGGRRETGNTGPMEASLPWGEAALRLLVAAALGAAIGIERERVDQPAGLRDHALVALGAALLMIVSQYGFTRVLHAPNVVLDPSRIAAQVVSGIGFIGAGTIIVRRRSVRGLTTAASVWAAAAIGLAAGGHLFIAAGLATVIALAILAGMRSFEKRLWVRSRRATIVLSVESGFRVHDALDAAHTASLPPVGRVEFGRAEPDGTQRVELALGAGASASALAQLVDDLRANPAIRTAEARLD